MRIAHLTDLHFGRDQPDVTLSLMRCLQRLKPDVVVISGDVTQRARHKEFRQCRAFLEQLKWPYLIVPGNHDLSGHRLIERFFFPWRKWRRYISGELEPVLDLPGARLVGVNSARRFGLYLDWSRGRVNARQLQRVSEQLEDKDSSALRILVAHHPFWLPTANARRSLIGNRDQALEHLSQSGVDLILGGHIHLAFAETQSGRVIAHAGTTLSNRLSYGQPNSFNLIDGDCNQLNICEWDWCSDDLGGNFKAGQRHRFVRTQGESDQHSSGRGGWRRQALAID